MDCQNMKAKLSMAYQMETVKLIINLEKFAIKVDLKTNYPMDMEQFKMKMEVFFTKVCSKMANLINIMINNQSREMNYFILKNLNN